MFNLQKIGPCTYLLPKEGGMLVPGLIIASEEMITLPELERVLIQVKNVAHLPGIVGHSIAMPDLHWGYGFCIGGVAATDAKTGVISPGGVGYDINCGVRLSVVDIPYKDLNTKKKQDLINRIFTLVPSGVGKGHKGEKLSNADFKALTEQGSKWSVTQGFGFPEDLTHTESHGVIEGANIDKISEHAKDRGRNQLGSIGSGNHFVEIGEVQTILDPKTAEAWGIEKGQTYILIHCGSRGFGHQVCQDTLNTFMRKGYAKALPDPQLVAAPIQSDDGQNYFQAMAAAANYAFNNRQQILWEVRQAFHEVLGVSPSEVRMIYDVAHNIAKFETHKNQLLCIHRKGATRAFGPGSKELIPLFQKTGQPVLVPGDMGRASYLMVGRANEMTWSSACHGAGRQRSRMASKKAWRGKNPYHAMEQQGVIVKASSTRTVVEEMPDAYKNVHEVVEATEQAGLADKVACLHPGCVVKG